MVQEFNVLRCFSCKTFQVHQVKKAKKWACKVCGEKQSLKKIYGQGAAPDCRKHVQKLNTMQGECELMNGEEAVDTEDIGSFPEEQRQFENEQRDAYNDSNQLSVQSKWEKFVEPQQQTDDQNQEQELWHGKPVTTDRTAFEGKNQKRKYQRKRKSDQDESQATEPARKRFSDTVSKDQNIALSSQESQAKCSYLSDKFPFEKEMYRNGNGELESTFKKKFNQIGTSCLVRKEAILSSERQKSMSLCVQNMSAENDISCQQTGLREEKKQNDKTENIGKQSKWSKFLGNSTKDNPKKPGENLEISVENMNSVSNTYETHSTQNLEIPQFVSNAKATRPAQQAGVESTVKSKQNNKVASCCSLNLFQIEDGLEDDWWNV